MLVELLEQNTEPTKVTRDLTQRIESLTSSFIRAYARPSRLPELNERKSTIMNTSRHLLILASILTLGACTIPQVKYSDMNPYAYATASGAGLTVHLGSEQSRKAGWVVTNTKVEGRVVYLRGYRSYAQESRDVQVALPAGVDARSVSVIWVNPNGKFIPVPVR
ncbi:MAG: hypothetical protein JWO08_1541 [Verrucomicrobiaceae bacterium]|nr:hypothetical protein [Verrucomicrobiaceae bacterium]